MSAKASRAIFRAMTPHERLVALALGKCRFPPASFAKRFAADISNQARLMAKEVLESESPGGLLGKITDRQARQLAIQAYRFRRQMPPELVPAVAPEGYSTPKMARDALEAERLKDACASRVGDDKRQDAASTAELRPPASDLFPS